MRGKKQATNSIKRKFALGAVIIIAAAAGFLASFFVIIKTDLEMRANLLSQTRTVAQSLNTKPVQMLSGSSADLDSPHYQRLKRVLQSLRTINTECRFIYLMGQKADGSVFFYMDSEPEGSEDYSPPGQIYEDVSAEYQRVFDTGVESIEGPVTDKWGTWISALIPVTDPVTGAQIAVLGMDIDAGNWNRMIFHKVWLLIMMVMLLIGVLVTAQVLFARYRRSSSTADPRKLRLIEPVTAAAIGLILTLIAVMLFQERDIRNRTDAFTWLANSRIEVLESSLRSIRDMGLESLARFYEGSANINSYEFSHFTKFLTANSSVQAWEWIPAVPRENRLLFEAEARASGLKDFEIWEKDNEGKRVPAAEREVYYPVLMAAPLQDNEKTLGFDLGSEPKRRSALEEAAHTGLSTASDPIVLVQEVGEQKGILIFRPVFAGGDSRRLQGFAIAVLKMDSWLRQAADHGYSALIKLYILQENAPPELLAVSNDTDFPTAAGLIVTKPVIAFGYTYAITVYADPDFISSYPLRAGKIAAVIGFLLTAGILAILLIINQRREVLERLVAERTESLQKSEESYHNQFSHNSAVMLLIDPYSGEIVEANTAALDFYGYSLEEIRSLKIFDINVNMPAAEVRQAMSSVKGAEGKRFQFLHRLADGSFRNVDVSSSRIQFEEREILHSIIFDITAQTMIKEALQESEGNFRTFFESMNDMIFVGTPDGQIFFTNTTVTKKLGYSNEELTSMHVLDVHPSDRRQEAEAIFGAMFRGERDVCPLPLAKKDGTLIPVETRVWFGRWNGEDCIFGISKDLTSEQEAQQRFERLFRNNPALMALSVMPDRRFTDVNDKFLKTLGYTLSEVVGKTAADLAMFPQPLEQAVVAETLLADGKIQDFKLQVRRKDGVVLKGLFSGEIINSQGHQYFLTVMIDITDRKNAEEALNRSINRLNLATKAGGVGIWEYDVAKDNLVWDDQMFRLYGITREQFGGAYDAWKSCMHPEDLTKGEEDFRIALMGEKEYDTEFRVIWPDGSIHVLRALAVVQLNEEGRSVKIIGTNWDITHTKKIEEELKDTVGQLEEQTAIANSANTAKSQFLANMSHEIRTPMNAVLGMLHLLQRTELSPRQLDYAQKIQTASQTLLALLNDILDFSKIEAGKLELEINPFSLNDLLRDLSVILSSAVQDKDVEILFSIAPNIPHALRADGLRLQQVLLNLTSNAIKFTEQGEVIISVQTLAITEERAELEFSVRDTGIGIAPNMQGQIFSGFIQAEASTTRRFGGTGLGLSISSQLVGLMGGELAVDSEPGRGSNFHFTISLELDPDLPEIGRRKTKRGISDVHALIVDDNAIVREVLSSMMSSFGWQAETASSGPEAIALVEAKTGGHSPFDVIFMDWKMPDMDGLEAAGKIKELLHGDKAPVVIMVTPHGREFLTENYSEESSPLDGFLVKPVTPSMLFDAVDDVISGRSAMDNRAEKISQNQQHLPGLRLLLAEDNLINQQVAEEILTKEGATVVVAASGRQAIEVLLREEPFDAVLMDIQMPDMDGYETTLHIRNVLKLKELPIIAMTANALPSDRALCLEAGMNDHIGKPFDVDKLIMVLRKNCGMASVSEVETQNAGTGINFERPGFDCDAALKRLNNNRSLYARMARTFEKDQGVVIERLRHELSPDDLHTIKGVAATLGATELSQAAAEGETELKSKSPPEGNELFHKVERLFIDACLVFKDLAERLEPLPAETEAVAAMDREEIITTLLDLENLLKTGNMRAMQQYQDTKAALESALHDRIISLDEAMQRLDFASAGELCIKLREELT
ncbi:MAG: PAS domain S-box protein [Spirochaetales bacterium]|nr:PAS domain S-box protein [Spirochaetales bacterium]